MKILATLFRGRNMEWKIRISPRSIKTRFGLGEVIKNPVFNKWIPDNDLENEMLLYDPLISLSGKGFFDVENRISVPITSFYTFVSLVGQAYNKLSTRGLFNTLDNELVIDRNVATAASVRLITPWSSVTIVPTLIDIRNGRSLRGVTFISNDVHIGTLDASELRAFHEILAKLDITTFSLMLSFSETIDNLDKKLDMILENQVKLLSMIERMDIKDGER